MHSAMFASTRAEGTSTGRNRPSPSPPRADPTSARDAVMGILMAPDRAGHWYAPVQGRTRLLKEIFLAKMETPAGSLGAFPFDYEAGKYGPWSREIGTALQDLELERLVEGTTDFGSSAKQYRLTSAGRTLAIQAWKTHFAESVQRALHRVKSNYNDWSYNALMVYVYQSYPSFTSNSLIRDEIIGEDP